MHEAEELQAELDARSIEAEELRARLDAATAAVGSSRPSGGVAVDCGVCAATQAMATAAAEACEAKRAEAETLRGALHAKVAAVDEATALALSLEQQLVDARKEGRKTELELKTKTKQLAAKAKELHALEAAMKAAHDAAALAEKELKQLVAKHADSAQSKAKALLKANAEAGKAAAELAAMAGSNAELQSRLDVAAEEKSACDGRMRAAEVQLMTLMAERDGLARLLGSMEAEAHGNTAHVTDTSARNLAMGTDLSDALAAALKRVSELEAQVEEEAKGWTRCSELEAELAVANTRSDHASELEAELESTIACAEALSAIGHELRVEPSEAVQPGHIAELAVSHLQALTSENRRLVDRVVALEQQCAEAMVAAEEFAVPSAAGHPSLVGDPRSELATMQKHVEHLRNSEQQLLQVALATIRSAL